MITYFVSKICFAISIKLRFLGSPASCHPAASFANLLIRLSHILYSTIFSQCEDSRHYKEKYSETSNDENLKYSMRLSVAIANSSTVFWPCAHFFA